MTKKKRNPQDLTLRNLRAAKRRILALERGIQALKRQLAGR